MLNISVLLEDRERCDIFFLDDIDKGASFEPDLDMEKFMLEEPLKTKDAKMKLKLLNPKVFDAERNFDVLHGKDNEGLSYRVFSHDVTVAILVS